MEAPTSLPAAPPGQASTSALPGRESTAPVSGRETPGPKDPTGVEGLAGISALLRDGAALVQGCSAGELVDLIGQLEDIKNQCSAAQTHAALALKDTRETQATTPGEREVAHRSVVSEIALARRESPHRARTLLGLATALHTELPHTLTHLAAGRISEYRATLVAKETACLEPEDRLTADRELAEDLPSWSNREVAAHARHIAYTLDPHSVVTHIERAEADRRVTIRPAPACMALITALLPVAQGVAVHATLLRAAESAHATGDARARAQVMADTLVTRITGQDSAEAVPVEVHLVITDDTLLGEGDTPARLTGYGPIPPAIARRLLTDPQPGTANDGGSGNDSDAPNDTDTQTRQWIRRLYTHPTTGQLIAMESTRRLFPPGLRRYIATRDANTCRTPWCGAPIAHIDHVTPARNGGPTTATNGQGLCIHCNQTKEAPGWDAHAHPDGTITLTTPTRHTHTTRPPPLPQTRAPAT